MAHDNAYEGAAHGRLAGGWSTSPTTANEDWMNESVELWARAASLEKNDASIAALINAMIVGTHGSEGLKHRSLVESPDDEEGADPQNKEVDLRDQIEDLIEEASCSTALDAGGQLHRRELDESLDRMARVAGESFAVYSWIQGRAHAAVSGCWRIVRRDRVYNPPGEIDGPRLYQGVTLDRNGCPDGIWIGPPQRAVFWASKDQKKDWTWAPWYNENGMQTVLHRVGLREPGAIRGTSVLSRNIALAKQTKGCLDAYVVAKRVQACHPIFIRCSDPVAAAKKDRNGALWGPNTTLEPGKTYYLGEDGEVSFPSWSFQGADLREFLDTLYRNQYAVHGLPIDVVLCQLGETNMAASRSAWQQYYRACDRWQTDHINQVSRPIDTAIVAEAIATGRLVLPVGMTLQQAMKGRYIRPPRSMPDPLKEAAAVEKWATLGRDLTGLWAESGVDFRESTLQRAEDDKWQSEYQNGKAVNVTRVNADAAFVDRVMSLQSKISASGVADLPWPVVIAAGAADTAPGAFIQALAKAPDQQQQQPTESKPDEAPTAPPAD